MKIENFFLRYAYPCAYIIMQRGEITPKELKELEDIAIKNKEISKERLEKVFHRAFGFIDELAKKKNKGRWDVIKEYFYSYHNKVIDNKEGVYAEAPHALRGLSRIETANVIDKQKDVLMVKYIDKRGNVKIRNVFNHFIPNSKVGDKVTIHYGYAVEIVGSE